MENWDEGVTPRKSVQDDLIPPSRVILETLLFFFGAVDHCRKFLLSPSSQAAGSERGAEVRAEEGLGLVVPGVMAPARLWPRGFVPFCLVVGS